VKINVLHLGGLTPPDTNELRNNIIRQNYILAAA